MKLTQEDTACFYDVFFKLIDYTNERYQVVPGLKKRQALWMSIQSR